MLTQINTSGTLYVTIFLGGLLLWPLFPMLGSEWTGAPLPEAAEVILPFIVNAVINLFIYRQCSAPALSYYEGLGAMTGRFIGGCVNLTILYIFFVILLFHVLGALLTLGGLIAGKGWTEKRFQELTTLVATRH